MDNYLIFLEDNSNENYQSASNPVNFPDLGIVVGCLNTYAATDCTAVTEISQIECESLLQLYHSTAGANWKNNEGWNVTNTPCSWHGITCENNSVMAIRLAGTSPSPYSSGYCSRSYYSKNLVGTIPNFKSLPNLQILSLSINKLTGEIPDFSGLPNLQNLSLSNNQLTGEIPNFSGLPNLQRLSLENNQLTGEIPNFNDLPNLQELYLGGNQLTGEIPDFSGLPNLMYLYIKGNQLTGTTNCSAVKGISQVECESLLQLYNSTGGPNWHNNDGWNVTNTPCSWYGITCENNGIVEIDLGGYPDNNLVGTIPDFNGLPNLQ
ncbi:receptor-like protein kinase [Beggiatoa sp. PS]|nr:receptor-like protein kinase [Beggiatoa sp. PS]